MQEVDEDICFSLSIVHKKASGKLGAFSCKKDNDMFDYYGTRWKKKRKHVLRLDGYMDRVSARYGRIEEATVVHHIYPADQYPEWAWEDWNLISVSLATHNKLENRKTGELTELGIKLQRLTTAGEDWREKYR